jgi:hypothetical protein
MTADKTHRLATGSSPVDGCLESQKQETNESEKAKQIQRLRYLIQVYSRGSPKKSHCQRHLAPVPSTELLNKFVFIAFDVEGGHKGLTAGYDEIVSETLDPREEEKILSNTETLHLEWCDGIKSERK